MKYFDEREQIMTQCQYPEFKSVKNIWWKKNSTDVILLASTLNLKGEKKTAQRVVVENGPPLTSVHLDLVLYEFSISVFIFS